MLGLVSPVTLLRAAMDEGGLDSNGKSYDSRDDMWREETGSSTKKKEWYQKGISYWEGIDPTVDGVLGGYGKVSNRDVMDSSSFLVDLLKERVSAITDKKLVALDCGAGVGRITKSLLLSHFHEVDLVEPVRHFLDTARSSLQSDPPPEDGTTPQQLVTHKAVNFICTPLQDFTPEPQRYDVIWVQWCVGHLTDDDFISFFKRAEVGLKPGGFFVLKENIARHGFVVDRVDSSITRSDAYFRDLFVRANLQLLKTKLQKGFPRELFAVRMYALISEQQAASSSPSVQSPARNEISSAKGSRQKTRGKTKRLNQPKQI